MSDLKFGTASTWRVGLRHGNRFIRVRLDHEPQLDERFAVRVDGKIIRLQISESPRIVIHSKFDMTAQTKEV